MKLNKRKGRASAKAQEMKEIQEGLDGTESGMDSALGGARDADYTCEPGESSSDYELDDDIEHQDPERQAHPQTWASAAAHPKKPSMQRKSTRGQHKKVPGGLSEADTKAAYMDQLRECLQQHDCEMNPADWTVELHARKDRKGGWDPCFAYKGHKVGRAAAAALTYACKLGPNATQKKQARVHLQDLDLEAIKAAYTERLMATLAQHGIQELPPGCFDIRLHKRNDRNSYRASYCYKGKVFRNPSHAVTAYLSELQEAAAGNASTATQAQAHQVPPTLGNCLSSTAYGGSEPLQHSPRTGSKRRRASLSQLATDTNIPFLQQHQQRQQVEQAGAGGMPQQLMWVASASKDHTAVSHTQPRVHVQRAVSAPLAVGGPMGHSPLQVGLGVGGVLGSPYHPQVLLPASMLTHSHVAPHVYQPGQVMALSCYGVTSKMSGQATLPTQPLLSFAARDGLSHGTRGLHVNTQRVVCVDDPSTPNQPPRSATDLGPTECGTADAIEGLFKLRHGSWEAGNVQAGPRFAFHDIPRVTPRATPCDRPRDSPMTARVGQQDMGHSGQCDVRQEGPESCGRAHAVEHQHVMKTAVRPFQAVSRALCPGEGMGDASAELATVHV